MDFVIMDSSDLSDASLNQTNHPDNWVANDEASIPFAKGIATLDGGNPAVIDWDEDD